MCVFSNRINPHHSNWIEIIYHDSHFVMYYVLYVNCHFDCMYLKGLTDPTLNNDMNADRILIQCWWWYPGVTLPLPGCQPSEYFARKSTRNGVENDFPAFMDSSLIRILKVTYILMGGRFSVMICSVVVCIYISF